MLNQALTLNNVNIEEIVEKFKSRLNPAGVKNCSVPGHAIYIFVMEEYFFRINSNLAAVVIFEQKEGNDVEVTIAVAGGGEGLLEISWGAENRMMKNIMEFFKPYESVGSR